MNMNYETYGNYQTEEEAAEAFDMALPPNCFRVHKEVKGTPIYNNSYKRGKDYRIDRLLIPTKPLINNGWDIGAVGVEIKRSKYPMGDVINQAHDYTSTTWRLENGIHLMSSWVLVFPAALPVGFEAKIMGNLRIGNAMIDHWGTFSMYISSLKVFVSDAEGRVLEIKNGNNQCTRTGTR